MPIAKIGHATFETPDLERLTDYYTDLLGLSLVEKTGSQITLTCPADSQSVVLRRGSAPRCSALSFETGPSTTSADIIKHLTTFGIIGRTKADPYPGIGASVEFDGPDGLNLEIVSVRTPHAAASAKGIAPRKLGHVAFKVPDVQKTVDFYVDVLGFRVSDWMGDFFAFLRCGPDHHTVNFLTGPQPKLHHIAFETTGWDHMRTASDFLARNKMPIIWGPGRHGIGHNVFTYHRNFDGQIIELYTDLDQMSSEEVGYFDPRPWHEDNPQKPKVWDPKLPSNVWGPPIPDGFRDG